MGADVYRPAGIYDDESVLRGRLPDLETQLYLK
jgi:hypothetical protein